MDTGSLKGSQPIHSPEEITAMVKNGHDDHSAIVKGRRVSDSRGTENRTCRFLIENLFTITNVVAILLGFIVGLLVRSSDIGEDGILWLGLPGELYMRILRCIVTPLIVCSVFDGTANTDPKTNGKLGLVAVAYMVISNSAGTILGLVMCVMAKPGAGTDYKDAEGIVDTRHLTTMDIIVDFIRNIFPSNMVGAALQVTQTKYRLREVVNMVNISGQLVNETTSVLVRSVGTASSTNVLGLIVISAALGIAASQAGPQARPFLNFFKAGATIIFKLFSWVKWTTPLGSASLIAASIAGLDDLGPAFRSMGIFCMLMVVGNIGLMQLVYLSLVLCLVRRQSPVRFFLKGTRPWLISFAGVSSSLPYLDYVRIANSFGVDPRVSDYVLPLSLTLNRIGSALFVSGACILVTQNTGVGTDVGSIITIGFLVILSSLAIPAVPSASVVAVVIILESMGVPSSGVIGLIMAMEWFNDRIRTTTNCLNHMVCVLTTWTFCKDSFKATADSDEPGSAMAELC